jgi:hypothetical protein
MEIPSISGAKAAGSEDKDTKEHSEAAPNEQPVEVRRSAVRWKLTASFSRSVAVAPWG